MSKWRDYYQTYISLRKKWAERSIQFRLDEMILKTPYEARKSCYKARRLGFNLPREQDLIARDEVHMAREAACKQGYPADDVYCVALRWLGLYGIYPARGQPSRIWRGQRKTVSEWPIQAKLFRRGETAKMLEHLKRLGALSIELKSDNPALQEDQCFAIAQHYSNEGKLATWLLDFTANPWVALFFASYQGEDGDIGIVAEFSCKEWSHLTADQFGYIRLIEAPGVPRIERQHAVFLEGSHSDIIEQYVYQCYAFKQCSDLVFRDAAIGIHEETLLPSDDQYLRIVNKWKSRYTGFKGTLPKPKGSEKLSPSDYYRLSKTRAARIGRSLSPGQNEIVRQLAQFHESLQRRQDDIPVVARSLRTFNFAVEVKVLQQSDHEARRTLDDVLHFYLDRARAIGDEITTERAWQAIKEEWVKIFPTSSSAH